MNGWMRLSPGFRALCAVRLVRKWEVDVSMRKKRVNCDKTRLDRKVRQKS